MSVMESMDHSPIQTTQKYLHTLPDTDQRNLDTPSPAPRTSRPDPAVGLRPAGHGREMIGFYLA